MTMRRLLVIALLLLMAAPCWAQQDPLYSQYLFNKLVLNPAYSGSREQLAVDLQARRQWAGFEGAPRTEVVTAHFPTPDLRHGFGMVLVNDRVGKTTHTEVVGTYAYRIPMGETGTLALGIKAGIRSYRVQMRDVATWDANDQAFNNGNNFSKGLAVVAPGVYFQNDLLYAGLSVSDLIPHKLYDPTLATQGSKSAPHIFAMVGAALPLGSAVKLKPAVLLRAVGGAPLGIDLTLAAAFKDRLSAGFTWRPKNALAFLLQAYVTKSVRIGYAYDLGLNATRDLATGGHELMLGFDLNFLQLQIDTPKPF
jgi:type IX secretion system PorP/SprF family membrane protein